MHAATVASLVQMEDPSTLVSLQAGVLRKENLMQGDFRKGSSQEGTKEKPRGGRFKRTFKDFKGKAQWTLEQIETFHKEGKCFRCGKEGHVAAKCPDRPIAHQGE